MYSMKIGDSRDKTTNLDERIRELPKKYAFIPTTRYLKKDTINSNSSVLPSIQATGCNSTRLFPLILPGLTENDFERVYPKDTQNITPEEYRRFFETVSEKSVAALYGDGFDVDSEEFKDIFEEVLQRIIDERNITEKYSLGEIQFLEFDEIEGMFGNLVSAEVS